MILKCNTLIQLILFNIFILLLLSFAFAEADSQGVTRDITASEEISSTTQPTLFNSCNVNFNDFTEEELRTIEQLESSYFELQEEIRTIRRDNENEFISVYNQHFELNNQNSSLDEYFSKINELEEGLGIIEKSDKIDQIREQLNTLFNDCYVAFDPEWISFKLSDEEAQQYNQLQLELQEIYQEQSKLYEEIQEESSSIYSKYFQRRSEFEEEVGIAVLQREINNLQSQINQLRNELAEEYREIDEQQRQEIEALESSAGINILQTKEREIQEQIEEVTGISNFYEPAQLMVPQMEFNYVGNVNSNQNIQENRNETQMLEDKNQLNPSQNNEGNKAWYVRVWEFIINIF